MAFFIWPGCAHFGLVLENVTGIRGGSCKFWAYLCQYFLTEDATWTILGSCCVAFGCE